MHKKLSITIIIISILFIFFLVFLYRFNIFQSQIENGEIINLSTSTDDFSQANLQDEVKYMIEEVATNLEVPWSIVFTSDDRFLFSERTGDIHEVINENLNTTPLITVETAQSGEIGLMSLEVDPNYNSNENYVYACIGYNDNDVSYNKVSRFTDENSQLTNEKILIDKIPSAKFHSGCRLRFAPDSTLYITTGDALNKEDSQDINILSGKILRINKDGTIPTDNPFDNSPVYSYGHRNPQGIDFHPTQNFIISTEHGPSGFDGRGGGDEVNLIEPGKNYGWPVVSHTDSRDDMVDPLLVFTPAEAPASGVFYDKNLFPQFKNNYFFGALRGNGIFRVQFKDDTSQVELYEKLPDIEFGRIRDISISPSGEILFSTSNTDSRGSADSKDDKILKLTPVQIQVTK